MRLTRRFVTLVLAGCLLEGSQALPIRWAARVSGSHAVQRPPVAKLRSPLPRDHASATDWPVVNSSSAQLPTSKRAGERRASANTSHAAPASLFHRSANASITAVGYRSRNVDYRSFVEKAHMSSVPEPEEDTWFLIGFGVLSVAMLLLGSCLLAGVCQGQGKDAQESHPVVFAAGSLAVGVLLAGVVLLYSGHVLGASVKYAVERSDQDRIGVDVSLGSLKLNPFRGVLTATDITIGNPAGYDAEYLLHARRLHVDVHMSPLLNSAGRELDVSMVHIHGLSIMYEKSSRSSNVQDFVAGVKERRENNTADSAAVPGDWRPRIGPPHEVMLHEVDIDGIELSVIALGGVLSKTVALAGVHYDEFSQEEQVNTSAAVAQAILLRIVQDTALDYFR